MIVAQRLEHVAEIHVAGLAGFLLAKCAAAYSRRTQKDWYGLAFVLVHNDAGGPEAAAQAVIDRFGGQIGAIRTALADLAANFANREAQGPRAYARQMAIDHPEVKQVTTLADAVVAVDAFCTHVMAASAGAEDPSDADPTGAVGPSSVPLLAAPCRPSQLTRRKLRHFLRLRSRCMIGDLGPVGEQDLVKP